MISLRPKKVDEKEVKRLQAIADREWSKVLRSYANPMITKNPRVVGYIDEMDTAYISLVDHKQEISANFVGKCAKAGLDESTVIRGVETHEAGHYVLFPRELSAQLFVQRAAHDEFKEKAPHIWALYSDTVNNLGNLRSSRRKEDIHALYRTLSKNAPEVERLIVGLYQEAAGLDFDIDTEPFIDKLEGPLNDKGERKGGLLGIDYTTPYEWGHAINIVTFGNIIKDMIEEPIGSGPGQGKGGEGESKGKGKGWGDTGGPANYSDEDIDAALRDIARKHGKSVYDMVRRFIGETKPDFQDPIPPDKISEQPFIGISTAEISLNDELVPFYERLSSTYKVYIAERPRKVNALDAYPEENIPFEVGDPVHKLNPWSTPKLLPGITKRFKDAFGQRTEWGYRIPDLFVVLDSSGSMPHPRYESNAVLTSFVLGRNYYYNGANVGMMNFSCDSLILPPDRDLNQFYRAACAYWGGGTVVNIEKLKGLFASMALGKELKPQVTTEEDYRKLLQKLEPAERDLVKRTVEEKRLEVKGMDPKLREAYQKIDNIIITDGAIWNMEELVGYLNEIGHQARNTIFVVNSPGDYRTWSEWAEEGKLQNTTVYPVDKPEDLVGLAIRKNAKRMADTKSEKAHWARRVA